MFDIEKINEKVQRLVRSVGAFIKEESFKINHSSIEVKSLNSLVTYVDKASEEQLAEGLHSILPGSGFLTEEKMVKQEDKLYTWIIDPIDGTTNFIHNLPFYCISVALRKNDDLILGIVYEINRKELFSAVKNQGAFLNGQPINVSTCVKLKDSLLATGFPYYDYKGLGAYIQSFEYFVKNTRGIRRFGSAALDLAYVACGRFDGFFEYGLNIWDVAGGIVIVREAGGLVQNFAGGEDAINDREIIAGNEEIVLRMSNVIKTAFGKN